MMKIPTKTPVRCLLPLLLALTGVGCSDESDSIIVDPSAAGGPVGLENGLFFARGAGRDDDRAFSIDVASGEARVVEHELPTASVLSMLRPGSGEREVVVLTAGRAARERKGKREDALNSQLIVFDRERALRSYLLGGRYRRLSLSDDGRFAVAFEPTGSIVLQNAIEVIDLTREPAPPAPSSTVVNLTLDGRAPNSLVFSPSVGFGPRRLLVMQFADAIQLLDLERPELGEISVPLKTPGDSRTLQPQEVLFSGDQLFVRASGSSQLLSLQLLPASTPHGFQPAPSLLTAGGNVTDIALVGSGTDLRVLALAGALEIFDPSRGSATEVEAAQSFSALLPFEGRSPVDTNALPRALVYAPGQSQVGFLDLGSDSAWATRTVELVQLGAPVAGVVPLSTRKLAVVLHQANRVSVVDLEQRTVAPIALSESLADLLLDETPARARLWLLTSGGVLATMDLSTLVTTEVPIAFRQRGGTLDLDDAASTTSGIGRRLRIVPGEPRRVAVLHDSDTGHLTLLNADQPTRESAVELAGFFLDGLFD